MTAVGQFLQSPLGFLENNIIVVGFDGIEHDPLNARIETMTFVTKPAQQGEARQMGRTLGLYFAVPQGMVGALPGVIPDGRTFNAYFCPYRQNDTLGTTVSNRADFMFTATMDGCSLGVGNAAPDGSRLIYHSNLGGNQNQQDTTLRFVMGATFGTAFNPSAYRFEYGQGVLKSTTMGIRSKTSRQWSFLSQIYFEDRQANPRRYYLREIKDIA
ncbi:MAG TPA: hypothetical protein VF286_03065 [Acidiphilium sp.]